VKPLKYLSLALTLLMLSSCPTLPDPMEIGCDHCYGGCPIVSGDLILVNEAYSVGYSENLKNPLWVCYSIFEVTDPVGHERPSRFSVDFRTSSQATHDAYTNSGYDRGHMAPNAAIDYCYGRSAQLETFLMSNICPQTPTLNRGIWATLEEQAREWANLYGAVFVYTGPIFDEEPEYLPSGVEIPDAFYKIVIDEISDCEESSSLRALAFVIPQDVVKGSSLPDWLRSIDEVELLTGINFLSELDDAIETDLESLAASNLWIDEEAGIQPIEVPTSCAFFIAEVDAVGECIVLGNNSGSDADLFGWSISDGEGTYTFSGSTVVQAGSTHTVCMDVYNPTRYTQGLYLNNKHDQVHLYDPEKRRCHTVEW